MHCLLLWQVRVDFLRVNWENQIRSLIRNRNKPLILVSQTLNLYNFGLRFLYITLFTYYRFRSPIFDIAKVLNSAIRINHTRINACATISNWPNIPFWMKSRFVTNDLEKKGQLHHLQGKLSTNPKLFAVCVRADLLLTVRPYFVEQIHKTLKCWSKSNEKQHSPMFYTIWIYPIQTQW